MATELTYSGSSNSEVFELFLLADEAMKEEAVVGFYMEADHVVDAYLGDNED